MAKPVTPPSDPNSVIADATKAVLEGLPGYGGDTPGTSAADPNAFQPGAVKTGVIKWDASDAAWYNLTAAEANLPVKEREYGTNARMLEQSGGDYGASNYVVGSQDNVVGAVVQRLGTLSKAELTKLQKDLKTAGYLGDKFTSYGSPDDATIAGFKDLLLESGRAAMGGSFQGTWEDFLNDRVTNHDAQTDPTKQIDYKLSGRTATRAALIPAFQAAIGRNPTDAELGAFMEKLHGEQQANPTVTTQTTDAQGNVVNSQTGGVDAEAFAQEQAQGHDEYAAYQVAAHYYPLMLQALGG